MPRMSFVLRCYRPHVEESGGEVSTPDLLLRRVDVVLPGRRALAVDVHAFSTDVAIQTRPSRTWGLAAWVLVGASRGTLCAPGVVHADRVALDADDEWLACRSGPHLVGRFAIRLAALAGRARSVELSIDDGEGTGGSEVGTLADAAATSPWLQALLDGAPLGKGRMVFFAAGRAQCLMPGARRIILSGPVGGRAMHHRYTVLSVEPEIAA